MSQMSTVGSVEPTCSLSTTHVAHADEGVTLVSPDGIVLYDSPSMALLGGYPLAARQGQPASAYIHADGWPELSRALNLLRHDQHASISISARWQTYDRGWQWLHTLATLGDPREGTVLLTSRDITAQVERNERWRAILDESRELAAQFPDRFWPRLLEAVTRIVRADDATVLSWDASQRELVTVQSTLPRTAWPERVPMGVGAAGKALERGAPVVSGEPEAPACATGAHPRTSAPTVLAVPLQQAGVVLGAVCLVRAASDCPFVPDEIEALVAFAGIASGMLLGRARVRLHDAAPVLNELRRELTLVIGYLEVLASDTSALAAPHELAAQALRAGWRAAWHVARLRRGDNQEGALTAEHKRLLPEGRIRTQSWQVS